MSNTDKNTNPLKSKISKDLRTKANDFLNNKAKANNLLDIIQYLEVSLYTSKFLTIFN